MLSISLMLLIVVTVAIWGLGFVTFMNNRIQSANRRYAGFCLALGLYLLSSYIVNLGGRDALFFDHLTYALSVLAVTYMALFANQFPQQIWRGWYEYVVVLSGTAIGLLSFTPFILAGVDIKGAAVNDITGPGYLLFVAYILIMFIIVFWSLGHSARSNRGLDRVRVWYVAVGLIVTAALIAVLNILIPAITGSYVLTQYSSLPALIFVYASFIAIARHHLFDIRLVIARSVTYLMLLTTLAVLYSAAMFGVTSIFFQGSTVTGSQNMVYVGLATVLALIFQPLRRFFERLTIKIFYRDHYDSEQVLNNFSQILVSERQLDRILKASITEICERLHIQFGQLVIFNNERVYRVEHFGKLPQRLMIAPELAELKQSLILVDELKEGSRKRLMENHGLRASLTLHTREEFVGYLLLGDKLSGDIFTSQDIEVLEIVTKQLAVAILNAKAYVQIEELNRTLQARVEHATNRLRIANRHLKELDRAKDEFISMASHQLRTPLTTIKGYLSMMLEGDAGRLTAAQKEFVGYAFGSSERMVNLISDLLNVSRLSAGRFLIQTKPTNMVSMIEDEVRQLKTHASAKNIQLIFDPPPEILPPAEIDENKTRQVVMNFIDNAIYYTNEGEVRVVLEQSGGCVRLEVRDTGIGVPEKAKKKLFSKFFRAENAQIVRPDGTGLGLYLAKRVVEDQGGTIIFNSVEGKGSTFGFELPFTPLTSIREEHHAK